MQPFGVSCADNVVKECAEEASVRKDIAQTARPVGAVSYHAMYPHGLKRDVLMCYDLELPAHFEPQPQVMMTWSTGACPVPHPAVQGCASTAYSSHVMRARELRSQSRGL